MEAHNASVFSDEDDPHLNPNNDILNDEEHLDFHFDALPSTMLPHHTAASREFVEGVKRNEMKRVVAMKKIKEKARDTISSAAADAAASLSSSSPIRRIPIPSSRDRSHSYDHTLDLAHSFDSPSHSIAEADELSDAMGDINHGVTPVNANSILLMHEDRRRELDATEDSTPGGRLQRGDHERDVRDSLFADIPEPYTYSTDFQRVIITETADPTDPETKAAVAMIKTAISLRRKFLSHHPPPPQDLLAADGAPGSTTLVSPPAKEPDDYRRRPVPRYDIFGKPVPPAVTGMSFAMKSGVVEVLGADQRCLFNMPPFDEFLADYKTLRQICYSGGMVSYSYKRLELLLAKFNLHKLLNSERETEATKSVPHRDFYNVRKVDTHIHHSACMNQKHLLRFIKHKLRHTPNEVVIFRDGKHLTLGEVFKSLNLTAYDLSIDTLDMHAHNTFQRFDIFNLKYNPIGESRLREIFLKTDNLIQGRYIAELTREVLGDLEASKYQLAEWRISIYGRKYDEWSKLAKWFFDNRLAHPNIRWLIQIPRLFNIYAASKELSSFSQMLYNIFAPLFAVTIDPSSDPALHYFLETIVGFDSVDDESKPEEQMIGRQVPLPEDWHSENPPYAYYMYFMYANICSLNHLRACRGLGTFQFRPHCGEAGDSDHLLCNYLLAHQINHGLLLKETPSAQYLYYLSQIGIAMSPLSNNQLFLNYNKNPFPKFFKIGLHVSLSTDDPLMLHYTKDALIEEYSIAGQVWKLSNTDQCELARNSVLQCGWPAHLKTHFLGKDYCDIRETNVPHARLLFRKETLQHELALLDYYNDR